MLDLTYKELEIVWALCEEELAWLESMGSNSAHKRQVEVIRDKTRQKIDAYDGVKPAQVPSG